jgi:hypothetical protein
MANYLTQQDLDNYGGELIDVSQRAALQVVAPYIQQLQHESSDLRARQAREQRRALDERVAVAIPDFREVDRNPRWHQWLLGIDLLSGRVRQQLLNEAIASSDVHRIKSLFDAFRRSGSSTQSGGQAGSSQSAGRVRSTAGAIYSRDQIARLYEQHRRGAYNGREQEWARLEHDIIRAGKEGRVLNPVDLAGK